MAFSGVEQIFREILPSELDLMSDPLAYEEKFVLGEHFEQLSEIVDYMERIVRRQAGRRTGDRLRAMQGFYDNLLRVADELVHHEVPGISVAGMQLAALVIRNGGDIEKAVNFLKDYCPGAHGNKPELTSDGNELDYIDKARIQFFVARNLPRDFNLMCWLHDAAVENIKKVAQRNATDYCDLLKDFSYSCVEGKKFPGALPILEESSHDVIRYYENIVECCRDADDKANAVENLENLICIDILIATCMAEDGDFSARARRNFTEHLQVFRAIDEAYAADVLISARDTLKEQGKSRKQGKSGRWSRMISLLDEKISEIKPPAAPSRPETPFVRDLTGATMLSPPQADIAPRL